MTRRAPPPAAVGDVVVLRSGGPPMTVFAIVATGPDTAAAGGPSGVALCFWFHGSELRSQSIPTPCLDVVAAAEDRSVN